MNKDYINLAKQAVEENWDAYAIMAQFMSLQKEQDAKLAELLGSPEIADAIRTQ